MNPNISIPPTAADAYRAMLDEQTYASLEEATVESTLQLNEAKEDEFFFPKFSFPKDKKQNYAKFLAANANRVGKPMIDGGLKADNKDAEAVNGQPVNDIIYCGDGCLTFISSGKKTFIQMNAGLLNTSDGSMSWARHKSYSGNAYISVGASEFKDIAKAVQVAAKF